MIRTPVANTKTNIIFILSIFVALYAILLVFVFLISRTIGKEVIKPISQLANHVCKIDAPDDKMAHINDDAIDEIKELEDSFEKMLERMNNSIIQEKKAYALALQAQMNPHFLYNMLAVISSAGSEAGCDSVSTMCVELSDMLRYVAAYQKAVGRPVRQFQERAYHTAECRQHVSGTGQHQAETRAYQGYTERNLHRQCSGQQCQENATADRHLLRLHGRQFPQHLSLIHI